MRIVKADEKIDASKLHWDPLTPEEEKEVLQLVRESYTREEIERLFAEEVESYHPMEDVIKELEEAQHCI